MSQHHLILRGHILPPITPAHQTFSSSTNSALFLTQGSDFELFREQIIALWSDSLNKLLNAIEVEKSPLKLSLFVGGPTLVWLERHAPRVNNLLDKLNQTGAIEWITGPMDHSLRFLYHRSGLEPQVYAMQEYILKRFGQRAKTLALPYFFYNTYFGYLASKMGMRSLIVPPRSTSTISIVPHSPNLRLIHAQPWLPSPLTQTEEHQVFSISINDLQNTDLRTRFFTWLKEASVDGNWTSPADIVVNGEPPEWDIQEHVMTAKPLGSNLEALEHPYCKNWLKHLQTLSRREDDIHELHNAMLLEAMLGYVEDQNPTGVYRSLLMRVKMLG